jgi:hypothetical protein
MIASVSGSSAFYSPSSASDHRAGLEADLARYKSQLADWCQCGSSKTDAGKAKIRELTDKVNQAEARLEKINNNAKARLENSQPTSDIATPANPASGTTGRLIDVRA